MVICVCEMREEGLNRGGEGEEGEKEEKKRKKNNINWSKG